ncbi:hypothetical protein HanRHA438_Chr01g0022721 [Helianthus annuus]|uniref:Uncharacterized protein n=1 Tax=Helianthus annuus TaxID=4232 RepID=A0A251UWC2_HELAN|nr:uncharacterized protein LOC110942191 [Helianthus annuus]KAF5822061.1 hypothetical protein HanXRQr2_Chr01g0022131 [Helianthus annuus]KAJ0611635.1 hypothetical protein HanHA300_Chr01g0018011 [Helianthus annuus]KAJ0622726.1 hypothetical protein HanIR_Chr01g0023941 [Helianthus annuus]KAJ0626947.1 hypothetical protein HanHA89_Chr01g0019801 [Helianthus annuus]KAJ0783271.1 hypothetical protein HanLR1_Chr01g0018491 [Helianthus annuus]
MQATMSHAPRQLTASNKTKASDNKTFDFLKPSKTPKLAKPVKPVLPRAAAPIKPARPPSDSKLMAGYLAHEYLTKGTLFGQPWDPARADVVPVSGAAQLADLRKPMKQSVVSQKGKPAEPKPGDKRKFESYAQVSGILMGKNGVHIPGIVNPTQLTRFLNLQ